MPGSGKQSAEVQAQIIEFLEAGIDPTTIHRRLKVGRSSIYRMKRCLQQHGQAYAPPEMNKKNGRPKVMTAEQELEIHNWLKDPHNRDRYLDDMVWFIHDRFGMVCSTTTCSKIKRKWVKVIEAEERGEQLHPAIALEQIRQEALRLSKKPSRQSQRREHRDFQVPTAPMVASSEAQEDEARLGTQFQQQHHQPGLQILQMEGQLQHDSGLEMEPQLQHQYREPQIDPRFLEQEQEQHPGVSDDHYPPRLHNDISAPTSHG